MLGGMEGWEVEVVMSSTKGKKWKKEKPESFTRPYLAEERHSIAMLCCSSHSTREKPHSSTVSALEQS